MSIFDFRKNAPSSIPGGEPIPESVLWLLLTGEMPTESEMSAFKDEMFVRGALTADEEAMIKSFPRDMHAMTQFSMGILACQPRSHFLQAYSDGVHKTKLWEPTFEDAIDLCAKVSRIGAIVFANKYGDNTSMPDRDGSLDYAANYANQLGFTDPQFWELMRLYICIHA